MSILKHASPPKLATLNTKPTWHNRAGRVDRSACLTLTAAKHWRHLTDRAWTYRYPARQSIRHAKGKCDRFADLRYWARDLWTLHKNEQPYPLQGDFRTTKSNAMRAHSTRNNFTQRIQGQRNAPIHGDGTINPNRGVGFNFYKRLGLDCMWQTNLRIERYVQHANLKQHFFVCPVCDDKNDSEIAATLRVAGPAGRRPAAIGNTRSKSLPPGRITKLYLPLCTPREYEDAHIAETWLKTNVNPNRPLSPIALQLIERYSELFAGAGGRQLRCRQCLGLRYGEVKPSSNASTERVLVDRRGVARRLPIQSEQALFLSNLPKLLASPEPRRRAKPTNHDAASRGASCTTTPDLAGTHRLKRIDALPASARETLLRLFATSLPAFKKLATVKQDDA
ncbi:MAG: hypothetical protein AB8C95_06360 [Phycisphaeraceae bacterium]